MPLVSYNGTLYRQFLIAVNQSSDAQTITLDALKIFVSNTGGDTINNVQTDGSGNLTGLNNANQVYDLGNNVVVLTSKWSSGNGTSDYVVLIKDADFQTAASGLNVNPYVYLYANMGGYQGYVANGGFEEFGVGQTAVIGTLVGAPAPDPSVSIVKTLIGVANTNHDTWTGDAGDVVSYQVVVTNNGDTTLTGLSVTDLLNGAVLSGTQSSTLAVGGTETLTASYTLTQADIDGNKSIVNTAQVTDDQQSHADLDSCRGRGGLRAERLDREGR